MKGKMWVWWIAWIFAMLGALDWLIVGLSKLFGTGFNFVDWLFGMNTPMGSIVYVLAGGSGLVLLWMANKYMK